MEVLSFNIHFLEGEEVKEGRIHAGAEENCKEEGAAEIKWCTDCKSPFPIPSVPLGGVWSVLVVVILILSTPNYFNF